MIVKKEEYVSDIRKNLRDGDEKVEITNLIPKKYANEKCRLFAKITLKQNCSVGEHAHLNEFEVYYIISGKGIADDDGKVVTLLPDDGMYTGFGANHSIKNTEPEDLVFIALFLLD